VDPDRIHPVTKEKGSPRIFFVRKDEEYHQGCDYVIRETRSQRRVKIGTDLGRPMFSDDRDETIADHAYDALRYLVSSRPPVATVAGKKMHYNSFKAVRQRTLDFKRRGGFRMLARQARRQHA
jgi:hypothetical protein